MDRTVFYYDSDGRLISVVDGNGRPTPFARDQEGRAAPAPSPREEALRRDHPPVRGITKRTTSGGAITHFDYDYGLPEGAPPCASGPAGDSES